MDETAQEKERNYLIVREFVKEIIDKEFKRIGKMTDLVAQFPSPGEISRVHGWAWWGAIRRRRGNQAVVILVNYRLDAQPAPWIKVIRVKEILNVFSPHEWVESEPDVPLADPEASKKISDQFSKMVHKHIRKR